jgi:hypothetical protein
VPSVRWTLLVLAGLWVGRAAAQDPACPPCREFLVNTYTTGRQLSPALAADGAGHFVVVWNSYGQIGSYLDVFGQRFTADGRPRGREFQVNTYTTRHQAGARVASDPNGNFLVVWQSVQGSGSSDVFGQRFDANGKRHGPEFRINSSTTAEQVEPRVAADAGGAFVVAWFNFRLGSSGQVIRARRVPASGLPQGPDIEVAAPIGGPVNSTIDVTSDPDGNFIVVWGADAGPVTGSDVFGRRFDAAGNPLGPEFQVNTYTTNFQGDPSIDTDDEGGFVVVWNSNEQDGDYGGVFGRRFDAAGVPQGPEFPVNSVGTGRQRKPAVSVDAAGGFVVVWGTYDGYGAGTGVFGRHFDAAGIAAGPEFRVNTSTGVEARRPVAARGARGGVVVTWEAGDPPSSDAVASVDCSRLSLPCRLAAERARDRYLK